MTLIENLKARRDAIGVELAALSSSAAGGKPNTAGEGGGVDHVGYKDGLYRELAALNAAISDSLAATAAEEGPFEILEIGET